MKKVLLIVVCCIMFCGCENNWEKIISIENADDSEYINGSDYTITVKGKTNHIYNVCIKAKFETYKWYSETEEEVTGSDTVKECKEVKYKETVDFVFHPKYKKNSINHRHKILNVTYKKIN